MVAIGSNKAIVISDVCGQRGGAYRATSLLCEALANLGLATTCYASWVEPDFRVEDNRWSIVRPLLRRGSRWELPHRVLAWQAKRAVLRENPKLVICVGMTSLCGMLLKSEAASQVYVWELTNAEPRNKFVSDLAVAGLKNCRGMLSPASVIDDAIRRTYSYQRPIHRLPFWIEPADFGYLAPPETFSCDFLFLSRREADKGLGDLLEAVSIAKQGDQKFSVVIAGAGPAEPWISQATQLSVNDRVNFVSLPRREDAMDMLRRARFMILPSWHEGFPISILEAAQRSVPIICTQVGAISEILGTTGGTFYHPVRNARNLAEVMQLAMELDHAAYVNARHGIHQRYQRLNGPQAILGKLGSLISP
jgi:glycosyltransferase involved in cell wall biosynthesis